MIQFKPLIAFAMILIFALSFITIHAQTQNPPTVAWNRYYWLDNSNWALGTWANGTGGDDNSGQDWAYDVILSKQSGSPNGYLTGGYTTIPGDVLMTNGLPNPNAQCPSLFSGNFDPFLTNDAWYNKDLSDLLEFDQATVASPSCSPSIPNIMVRGHENALPKLLLTDLNGNLIWYNTYGGSCYIGSNSANGGDNNNGQGGQGVGSGGRFYKVIQTSDGGYLAIGSIGGFMGCQYRALSDNATSTFDLVTISNTATLSSLLNMYYIYIAKVDANGTLLWQTCYGWDDLTSSNFFCQSHGYGAALGANGNIIITGAIINSSNRNILPFGSIYKGNLMVAEINPTDGSVVSAGSGYKSRFFNNSGLGLSEQESVGRSVIYNSSNGMIYVSGFEGIWQSGQFSGNTVYNSNGNDNAMVASLSESSFSLVNTPYSYSAAPPCTTFIPGVQSCISSQAASFSLAVDNTSPTDNVIATIESAGCLLCGENAHGTGVIGQYIVLDPTTLTPVPTVPQPVTVANNMIGKDLWMGLTSTVDATGTPDGFAISTNVPSSAGISPCSHFRDPISGADETYQNKEIWNTDAWVAKYGTAANGYPQLWAKVIRESTPPATTTMGNYDSTNACGGHPCTYGNVDDPTRQGDIKRQECYYNIIQGSDPGSLVLCGNNSNNLDDDVLLKLNAPNCQTTTVQNVESTINGIVSSFSHPIGSSNGTGYYINITTTPGDTIFIGTGATTWSTNGVVYGTVVVAPGATLNIENCTLQFLDYLKTDDNNVNSASINPSTTVHPTKIVVQPGGVLNVNNATLEGLQSCGDTWYGIEVWGNNTKDQHSLSMGGYQYQGLLYASGSTFKDMYWGIIAEKPIDLDNGVMDLSMNGGIIIASSCQFLENVRCIGFSQYTPALSGGDLSGSAAIYCTFSNTTRQPAQVISLWDHHGFQMYGNHFSTNSSWGTSSGSAIVSVDAEYQLGDPTNAQPPNTFANYYRGVFALGTSPSHFQNGSISTEHNTFTNCYRSIYMQGVDGTVINSNAINHSGMPYADPVYGIYLDGCNQVTPYFCQNNILHATSNSTLDLYGMLVGDHTINPTQVRNNTVTGYAIGLYSEGLNGGQGLWNGPQTINTSIGGLEYLCNSLSNSAYDIILTDYQTVSTPETGILPTQGTCGQFVTLGASAPAEDKFNNTPTYANIVSFSDPFYYLYPTDNGVATPSNYYPPVVDGNTPATAAKGCQFIVPSTGDCQVQDKMLHLTPGLPGIAAAATIGAFDISELSLIGKIDDGLTIFWKGELALATPSSIGGILDNIYKIDVVSSDLLLAIVNHPLAATEPTRVYNILVKNSGLSEVVVDAMVSAKLPFSTGEVTALATLQNVASPELSALSEIAALKSKKANYKAQLAKDWVKEGRQNDLITLLSLSVDINDHLMLAGIYLNEKNTAEADKVIDRLSGSGKVDAPTLGLLNLESNQIKAGLNMNQLNSTQVSYLQSIAYTYGSPAFLRAQALLALNNVAAYQEYLPAMPAPRDFGVLGNKMETGKWTLMHTVEKQSMTLLPNPATSSVIVTVQLDNVTAPAQFQITDMMGQLVYSQDIQNTYNTITVPLDRFNPGLYLCSTYQSGKAIFNSKLSVIKSE